MPPPSPASRSTTSTAADRPPLRLYDDNAEDLLRSDLFPDRVSLLPTTPPAGAGWGAPGSGPAGAVAGGPGAAPRQESIPPSTTERIRIMWGQDMLRDVLDGRYRAVVCGVNDADNSHGIIAQFVDLIHTSQWTPRAVTSFAKMFQESVSVHAAGDREPYVLKYDLDSLLILALLRPRGRDHFTLEDLSRGFATITKMLRGRRERLPVASVSFLAARANRLIEGGSGPAAQEPPSFESVIRTMYNAGYRGDIYPAPAMWRFGHVGVFPSYPFPEGLERIREGSS